MSHHDCPCFCFIAPPDLLAKMATEGDAGERDAAIGALATSAAVRARRSFVAGLPRDPPPRGAPPRPPLVRRRPPAEPRHAPDGARPHLHPDQRAAHGLRRPPRARE